MTGWLPKDERRLLAGYYRDIGDIKTEKVYRVEGRKDGTFLHLTFTISRDKFGNSQPVTLAGMWLQRHPIPIQPDTVIE